MPAPLLALSEILAAAEALPSWVRRTPVLPLDPEGEVWAKAESLQVTGSYKIRAAWTVLSRIPWEDRPRGAALSSSGNFAAAFAFAGRALGIPTTVVMMERTQPNKVRRTRELGAEVVLCENRFEARFETLRALEAERGLVVVDHLESRDVLAGHGTVGLEIAEDLPEAGALLVPVSTAGLLAGVAAAVKVLRPQLRVYGVQPEGADATARSLGAGEVVSIPEVVTICDALTSTRPGGLPFAHVQALVDDVLTVSDEAVAEAVGWLAREAKLVVEPGGAIGLAALRSGCLVPEGRACVLLSGGNLSPERLAEFALAVPR